MIITELNKDYRYEYTKDSVVDVKVFKTEEGFITAELVWKDNEYPTASELMGLYKTIGELNKEFHLCADDLEFEIIIKEEI